MKKIIVTSIEMLCTIAFALLIMGSVDAVANLIAFVVLGVVWFVGEFIVNHKFRLVITEEKDV